MPYPAPPVADEREGYAAYLAQHQLYLRAAVAGLPDDRAGERPVASDLTLGTLVKHVTLVQDNWLAAVLAAPELAARWSDADAPARWRRALTWAADDTMADALAEFDRSSDDVLRAARAADPDTPVPVHRAPWTPRDVSSWSVRWVWLHLVTELARHAGHADIIREQLDGRLSFELLATWEGDRA